MRDSWLELVDRALRPARPSLAACLSEAERHRAKIRSQAEQRDRALSACRWRIDELRAAVFAAGDGVIPAGMTQLEREWRALARRDPDDAMMDLWARIAPSSWVDRKRWRHGDPSARLQIAVALAADVAGVEAAEAAARTLRAGLLPWGVTIGELIHWRPLEADNDSVSPVLAPALQAASEALSQSSALSFERARQLELAVLRAANERFPARPVFAQSLAHAARVDSLLRSAGMVERPNPLSALRDLWRAGYSLGQLDSSGMVIEIPPLP